MTAFSDLLKNARAGLDPWAATPPSALQAVSQNLRPEHFPEIIAQWEYLAAQRQMVERDTPWDGDTCDMLHHAQAEIFRILAASPLPAALLLGGLSSPSTAVRFWVALTLKEKPDSANRPALQTALAKEIDPLARLGLQQALAACPDGPA